MGIFTIVVFWVAAVSVIKAEMESAIIPSMDCGSRLELDEAQIHFTSSVENVVLYATNLGCWECTETLVTSSQNDSTCSGLWAPHGWNLYFRDTQSTQLYAEKQFDFGEHGQYEILFDTNEINGLSFVTINELVAPVDSLAPVVTLSLIILVVVIFAFGAPPLATFLLKYDSFREPVDAFGAYLDSLTASVRGTSVSKKPEHSSTGPLSEVSVVDTERDFRAGTMPLLPPTGAGRGSGSDRGDDCGDPVDNLVSEDRFDVEGGLRSSLTGPTGTDSRLRRTNSGVSNASGGSTGRFSDVDNTTKNPFGAPAAGKSSPALTEAPVLAPPNAQTAASITAGVQRSERLVSLDSFRGIALAVMTFANYGAGGYWFLDHAAWNGLTVADMVFPWFMFMMGVSMALSYASVFKKAERAGADMASTRRLLCYKAARRTLILFTLGMFMANGFNYTHWRIPGVLQYFAFSYGVTSFTVLLLMSYTSAALAVEEETERTDLERSRSWRVHPEDRPWLMRLCGDEDGVMPSMVMRAYRYEWAAQLVLVVMYLSISLGAQAPGCPRGYQGPGGIGNGAQYPDCTGGIHRWIDVQLFGMDHIYLNPTCKLLYGCVGYDPEGTLGALTACTLTYLGLMTGRVLVHFKSHEQRLRRWAAWAFALLLLCGALCGFSQNDGLVPINKNMWSTSFGLITAGTGIIGLGVCYVLMDVLQLWTGAPFNYLGMNSILFYMGQAFFHRYFPFSYSTDSTSHASLLQMNVIGTCCWFFVAYWCWKKKFFLKI